MTIRGNNFLLDLGEFEKLSREVGFYNSVSGFKDDDDRYDDDAIQKYEELRENQLIMFEAIIEAYGSPGDYRNRLANAESLLRDAHNTISDARAVNASFIVGVSASALEKIIYKIANYFINRP